MFLRALIAFLVLPGMVAGVVPLLITWFDPWRLGGWRAGYAIMAFGLVILLWCVRDFYIAGKGTLAPWSPPQSLVVVGLYRFVRNPMYVGVITILLGWYAISGSMLMLAYSGLVAAMFHMRVTRNEEPWLQRKFADAWLPYSAAVGRWWPRLTPWHPNGAGS